MTYQKNLHSGFTLLDGEDIILGQGSAVKGLMNRPADLLDNVGSVTGYPMATLPDLTQFIEQKDVLMVEAMVRFPNTPSTAAINIYWATAAAPTHPGILGYQYASGEHGMWNSRCYFMRDQTNVTRFSHVTTYSKDGGTTVLTNCSFGTITWKPWDYAVTGPLVLQSDSTVLGEQVLMYGFNYNIIKSGA